VNLGDFAGWTPLHEAYDTEISRMLIDVRARLCHGCPSALCFTFFSSPTV
jgi:hypothetical protein